MYFKYSEFMTQAELGHKTKSKQGVVKRIWIPVSVRSYKSFVAA